MKSNDWILILAGFTMGAVLGVTYATATSLHSILLGTDGRLQWETLLAGVLALVGAVLTVVKIREQIRQTSEIARDQRQRQARAARSMLPLALSELSTYAQGRLGTLFLLHPCFRPDGSFDQAQARTIASSWAPAALPENVLDIFKECIEFVDDDAAEALATLIREIQVQTSRLTQTIAWIRAAGQGLLVTASHIYRDFIDVAEILARVNTLFPFARGDQNCKFEITPSAIRLALTVNGIDSTNFPELWSRAGEWKAKDYQNP